MGNEHMCADGSRIENTGWWCLECHKPVTLVSPGNGHYICNLYKCKGHKGIHLGGKIEDNTLWLAKCGFKWVPILKKGGGKMDCENCKNYEEKEDSEYKILANSIRYLLNDFCDGRDCDDCILDNDDSCDSCKIRNMLNKKEKYR